MPSIFPFLIEYSSFLPLKSLCHNHSDIKKYLIHNHLFQKKSGALIDLDEERPQFWKLIVLGRPDEVEEAKRLLSKSPTRLCWF